MWLVVIVTWWARTRDTRSSNNKTPIKFDNTFMPPDIRCGCCKAVSYQQHVSNSCNLRALVRKFVVDNWIFFKLSLTIPPGEPGMLIQDQRSRQRWRPSLVTRSNLLLYVFVSCMCHMIYMNYCFLLRLLFSPREVNELTTKYEQKGTAQ
jgi:hypothetical protein